MTNYLNMLNLFFVDTTRSIYQKKLAAILQKGSMVEATPEQSNGADEKFSDSEEDDVSVTELVVDSQTEQTEEAIESFETVESVEFVEAAEIAESADTVVAEPRVSTPSLTSIRKRTTDRPGSSLNALPLVDKQVSFQVNYGNLLWYIIYIFYKGHADTTTKHSFNQLFIAVHIWITTPVRHYWWQFGPNCEFQLGSLP